jgi:ABC-type Zn2+ transport system substrate-binding protein/surface adhesin
VRQRQKGKEKSRGEEATFNPAAPPLLFLSTATSSAEQRNRGREQKQKKAEQKKKKNAEKEKERGEHHPCRLRCHLWPPRATSAAR